MSDLLSNVGKVIKKSSKDAVKKTKDVTKIVKLKGQIIDEERNIKKTYEELGKAYYKLYGNEPYENLQKYCSSIFLSSGNIKHLKKEIICIKNNQ